MKAFFFKLFLLITVFVLSNADLFAQYTWTKYPGNPVFPGGPGGSWYRGLFTPCVLLNADSTRFEMWFAASTNAGGGRPWQIGFTKSNDGVEWTVPEIVLTPRAGNWDNYSLQSPFVIRENGQYKMWYTSEGPSYSNIKIGYATSPDGINWNRLDNPIFEAGKQPWEAGGVGACCVMPIVGGFKMWYVGATTAGVNGKQCLGYATSTDGISWQRDTLHNPVLEPGATGKWDDYWLMLPRVLLIDDLYYMWYGAAGGYFANFRVGLATSIDGINWDKYSSNPVLSSSPSGWDNGGAESGSVVMIGDSLLMFYDGSNANLSAWQIGLATSPNIVPVELTSFTATSNGKVVMLNWSTATELNNLGFEIQRSTQGQEYFTIGFVEGNGTTTGKHNYNYADRNLNNGTYYYRLKQVDFNGAYEYSDVVGVEWRAFNSYLLEQNYPNPFNPATTIGFGIQEKSSVKIAVLNSIGEEVAVVVNEEREPGFYQLEFNAASLPSGVYFYQLKAGSYVQTRKMLLVK